MFLLQSAEYVPVTWASVEVKHLWLFKLYIIYSGWNQQENIIYNHIYKEWNHSTPTRATAEVLNALNKIINHREVLIKDVESARLDTADIKPPVFHLRADLPLFHIAYVQTADGGQELRAREA